MPEHIRDIGLKGLNEDTPSFNTSHQFFNDGLNMRVLDNQLQGVVEFTNSTINWDAIISGSAVNVTGHYDVTQQTPPGSNFFNLVSLAQTSAGLRVLVVNESALNTIAMYDLPVLPSTTPFIYNERYGSDMFVFNEVVVVNTGTTEPLYASAGAETRGDLRVVPNWFSRNADTGTGSSRVAGTLNGTAIISRKMARWNNRLVAMNLAGGANEPVSVAFSSTITGLDSLLAVVWNAAATNNATRRFITETAGAVLDGGALGDYFMVYKEDSAHLFSENRNGDVVLQNTQADDGIFSSRCFIDLGNGNHLTLGNHGFYRTNGSQKEQLARGRVEESLYADIASGSRDRTFMYHNVPENEAWICYRSVGSTGNGCNRAYVYNYLTDTWYKRSLGDVNIIRNTNIDGGTRVFAANQSNERLLELGTTLHPDGYVQFNKQTFGNAEVTKAITALYPGSGNRMRIGLRPSDNLVAAPAFDTANDLVLWDPAASYKQRWRMKGRYFDMYLGMDGSTNPGFSGIQIESQARGRRG